jgi:Asp-tRNA(Asn)/Glu-tRNA(Gln) amidotransferase A subunit family amidase
VTRLSRWIESRKLTSERLTNIYLDRIARLDPKIRSVITLTKDHALSRAKAADAEIAAANTGGHSMGFHTA